LTRTLPPLRDGIARYRFLPDELTQRPGGIVARHQSLTNEKRTVASPAHRSQLVRSSEAAFGDRSHLVGDAINQACGYSRIHGQGAEVSIVHPDEIGTAGKCTV
jgi:hypothetical protein